MKTYDFFLMDHINIVKLNGSVGLSNLQPLVDYLDKQVRQKKYQVVFDLTDTTWLDSNALAVIALSVKNAVVNSQKVCMIKPRENIVALIQQIKILPLVLIFNTVDEALQYYKKP